MLFTPSKPKLLIFDVNGTLLNMQSIKEAMNYAYKSPLAFNLWFSWLLHYSLVDTVTKSYHTFSELAKASMQMTATALEAAIDETFIEDILKSMQQLPPYPEVVEALNLLKKAGYQLVTLTNSAPAAQEKQLEFAQLNAFFEDTFSVDKVKLYKPHPETYEYVLDKMDVKPKEAMLIAAHGWDVGGAVRAGMQAAFIARKEQALYPLAEKPRFVCADLLLLAQELVKL